MLHSEKKPSIHRSYWCPSFFIKFFSYKSNKMCLFINQVTISSEVNSSQLKYQIGANGFLIITAPPVSGKNGYDEF